MSQGLTTDVETTPAEKAFHLPPVVHNARGEVRKARFEFEYADLQLEDAAHIVQSIFGGEHVVHNTFMHEVKDSRLGDFSVEIDSSVLKDRRYEKPLRSLGVDVDSIDTQG